MITLTGFTVVARTVVYQAELIALRQRHFVVDEQTLLYALRAVENSILHRLLQRGSYA